MVLVKKGKFIFHRFIKVAKFALFLHRLVHTFSKILQDPFFFSHGKID